MVGLRSAIVAAAAVGLLAGCRPGPQDVYVDVAKAVLPRTAAEAPIAEPDRRTGPETSTTFSVAPLPEVTEPRSVAEGAAKVTASIAANRDKTYRAIVRRLHDAYAREAANLRAQQLAAFEPVRAKTMVDAMAHISDAYQKYADAVGPKIARLAVNAGFPDPDKEGRRKPSGVEGLDTLAYETSQQLRAEIAALKADFKRYSDSTLRAASADVDAKVTALLANVDRQVGDIDARAEEVASREVSQAQAKLGPLLADRPPEPLPAVPGAKVVVNSGALPSPLVAPALPGLPGTEDSLAQAEQDLRIWLAVNRYRLQRKGVGRDATAEFIAWRNQFRQAPSGRPLPK